MSNRETFVSWVFSTLIRIEEFIRKSEKPHFVITLASLILLLWGIIGEYNSLRVFSLRSILLYLTFIVIGGYFWDTR